MFVNLKISHQDLPFFPEYDWLIFVFLLAASILTSRIFQGYVIRLTNAITFNFEITILKKIRDTTFPAFQKVGIQKIYTGLEDTRILGQLPESFINVINAFIVIACGVGYLFWVSPLGALGIIGIMAGLLVIYLARNRNIEARLDKLRDLQDSFHKYVRDLLMGFREIKMSSRRSKRIYEWFILNNRKAGRQLNTEASIKYLDNELTGRYSWYLVLGSVFFILPVFLKLKSEDVTAFAVTILYLMGPVAILVAVLPYYTRVKIALKRLDQLDSQIDSAMKESETKEKQLPDGEFQSLTLENVTFDYFNESAGRFFKLGPISIDIVKGELIFLTGGNGSGKSTFVNILTGLYQPSSGRIYYNNIEITPELFSSYRDRFAAVFSDGYLLNENYDEFDLSQSNEELVENIRFMRMEGIFKIKDTYIDKDVSKGQSKRVALITALLEQKSLIVLDEWAAEQDPEFKKYFYADILQKFKAAGKTLLVVTHDDRYFETATRVVKFEYGKIISDVPVEVKSYQTF